MRRARALLLLAMGGCWRSFSDIGGKSSFDSETGGITDADGDGYSEGAGDCAPDDPAINPGADDIPGDGIDSDCDEKDDS